MRTNSRWLRTLAALSALVLVTAGCGGTDVAEETDAPPMDDAPEAAAAEHSEPTTPEPNGTEGDAPDAGSVTAYVVGYHWGWALFDEDGNELDVLAVPIGTEVELIAVNDHASHAIDQLPDAVAASIRSISFHERAHHDVEMGRVPDPVATEGVSLSDALSAAHDGHDHMGPTPDHGLLVAGIGAEAFLDAHGDEPQRLVFTVEREGVHEFRCTEECGVGHENQRWEMLVASA
jgi:hypothetical protein